MKTPSSTSLSTAARRSSQTNTAMAASGTSVATAKSSSSSLPIAAPRFSLLTAAKSDSIKRPVDSKTNAPKSEKTDSAKTIKTTKSTAAVAAPTTADEPVDAQKTTRFNVCLLTMSGIFGTQLMAQSLLAAPSSSSNTIGSALALFTLFFALEWCRIHSRALTRIRRAYFDEANVLETYQPRARTHGHLFKPDPPTPGQVSFGVDSDKEKKSDAEQTEFNNARDNHYANMYQFAIQRNKEMEAMQASGMDVLDAASPSRVEKAEPVSVDAILAENKKKEDERKARQQAESDQNQGGSC